jgi:fido (protein-threonine AMPylation protein)
VRFPWDEDDPRVRSRIRNNLVALRDDVLASGRRRDVGATVELMQDWHRRMLRDVPIAQSEVAGGFRGSGPTGSPLRTYRVTVDQVLEAVRPGQVRSQMSLFMRRLKEQTAVLDPRVAPKAPPEGREAEVLELCAWAHGEVIRIHPFADGNGRMARGWVLWLAGRYGLPVFLDLQPRPSGPRGPGGMTPYEAAATASMTGRHRLMQVVLTNMLTDYRARQPAE